MEKAPVPVVHLAETGSTNGDAMARATSGAALPFWLLADRQTAGRGRSGRVWVSEPGNLHATLALRLACGPARAAQLSLVAGVAVMDAIGLMTPTTMTQSDRLLQLKWPNDILIGGSKCGGILVETTSSGPRGGLIAVIGIGLNLVSAPSISDRQASYLAQVGLHATPKSMVAALATAMDSALVMWNEGVGFSSVRQHWLASAAPLGTRMTVNTGQTVAEGQFAGLDVDGALLLRDSGERIGRFTFGDVTLQSAVATHDQLRGSTLE
jgi:BirA family transcriptional regulator, biotin operon repressor / biotin---[acetyl-CoA-carboxylase] ligase